MNIYTVEIWDNSCSHICIATQKYRQTNRQIWSIDYIHIHYIIEELKKPSG